MPGQSPKLYQGAAQYERWWWGGGGDAVNNSHCKIKPVNINENLHCQIKPVDINNKSAVTDP